MRWKLVFLVVCAAAVAAVAVPSASASGFECNGLYEGTVTGPVLVKPGDSCTIEFATVYGGITQQGGSLDVFASTVYADLIVKGGQLAVNESDINGGWSITGNVTPEDGGFCANNVLYGGLNVYGITNSNTFSFGDCGDTARTFQGCQCRGGGTITGRVSFANNPKANVELDSYDVGGGVQIINNHSAELEDNDIGNQSNCQAGTLNDEDGPNSYDNPTYGCP